MTFFTASGLHHRCLSREASLPRRGARPRAFFLHIRTARPEADCPWICAAIQTAHARDLAGDQLLHDLLHTVDSRLRRCSHMAVLAPSRL